MIRKMLVVAAAIAMPVSMVALTGGVASATKTPPVDGTSYTATCSTISGTAKFIPAVTESESAGSAQIKIKASLSGCSTNAPGVTLLSGKGTGTLTTTRTAGENGCTALAGGSDAAGTLTVKWKTSGAKLAVKTSAIAINSIAGGIAADGNASFTIPGTIPNGAASGNFQGSNGGASDVTTAETTQGVATILTTCTAKKGLKSIGLQSPASGPALTLG